MTNRTGPIARFAEIQIEKMKQSLLRYAVLTSRKNCSQSLSSILTLCGNKRSYATIRLSDLEEKRKQEIRKEQQAKQEKQEQSNDNYEGGEKKEPFISITQLLFFGIPAITTFCLGIWQTRRYMWKKDQIKLREKTLAEEPIPYNPKEMLKISPIEEPETSSSTPSIHAKNEEDYDPISPAKDEYLHRIVSLEGYFDYSNEIVVGLRKSPLTKRLDLPTSMGEMGFFIITPFILNDG